MSKRLSLTPLAPLLLSPVVAWSAPGSPAPTVAPDTTVCQTLLPDSARLLAAMLDLWTGLPYDQIPCDCAVAGTACTAAAALGTVARAGAVVPQLANASLTPFSQDGSLVGQTVDASFVDQGPDGQPADRLFALRLALHLTPGTNTFGGLLWGAHADLTRYTALRIRYSTSVANDMWELKLNSGAPSALEKAVRLPGTPAGQWREERFVIDASFPGTVRGQLNYITFAAAIQDDVTEPVLWVDQLSFEADPAQMGSCAELCPSPAAAYPDLACHEPYTGAVNIANALSTLSLMPSAGLLDAARAKAAVTRILSTLAGLPGGTSGSQWFQDWHSPASGMPDPRNHVSSLTDQPQLYAALMVVERTWPDLAPQAAAIRERMDFSILYDGTGGCPGVLHGAIDRCTGVRRDWKQEYLGNDSLLGSFLAVASEGAPACVWDSLAVKGCALDGPVTGRWYTTGRFCLNADIPASDTGGPFLQLAAPLYLSDSDVPLGPLPLAQSAGNMLRAQLDFAAAEHLSLAGWTNASDPDKCDYMTCEKFTRSKVTPYISAMGLDLTPGAAANLLAFHAAGADAPLVTGTTSHRFGPRDSWNQTTGSARDSAYLYLDAGWSVLGMLNYCSSGLTRWRFSGHPVAQRGYALLKSRPPVCGPLSSPAQRFFSLTPCRLVDTRNAAGPFGGPALDGQQARVFSTAGRCGIPSSAKALAVSVVATDSTAAGHLVLFPAGPSAPATSTVNYAAGQTKANNAVVPLSAAGELAAYDGQPSGATVHLVIDVNGYFE